MKHVGFYTPWLRISFLCKSVKVLNDTQIYTLWEFSMPNTNLGNKTPEFLPEQEGRDGLRKVQWICKQQRLKSSLLNLPLEETTYHPLELLNIMELWFLTRPFLLRGQVGCCNVLPSKQNTPDWCRFTYRLLHCFPLEKILENNRNLRISIILVDLI